MDAFAPSIRRARTLPVCIRLALGSLLFSEVVWAEKYFDRYAINLPGFDQELIDLDAFAQGQQLPGTYRVDVSLNGQFQDTRDVTFVMQGGQLQPQLSVEALKNMGVNTAAFPAFAALQPGATVTALGDFIPQAATRLDFNTLQLNVSIPQAALDFTARNASDPSTWDQGMPAFLVNYTASGSNTWQRRSDGQSSNAYLNLGTGLNLGAWRLRNTSTYTRNEGSSSSRDVEGNRLRSNQRESQWQSINTYAQRDVQPWRGQLTLGESYTSGDVFDSVQFRGVQLASDDNMLPDSLRGYAPVIRGIANSDARVTVQQNGYVIYQSYVAAGAFVIRDIYPTSSSGNLDVTITESDGTERTFAQPFSAVPIMQREGGLKYAVTGGQYRTQAEGAQTPMFVQSHLIYGLHNSLTLYGGAQLAGDYTSALVGVGQGLGTWGSVSVDATQADTRLLDGSRHKGQSYRVQYAKDVFQSGTTFTLAGYRYSTAGFYDFREANEINAGYHADQHSPTEFWRQGYNKRSRMQVQVSQSLGDYGSLYVNAFQQDYWKKAGQERTFSAGYSATFSGVTYGFNVDATQYPQSRTSKQVAFSVQIPLGASSSSHWARYGIQTDNNGFTRQQAGINGQALEDRNLNYSVQQSYGNRGAGNAGSSSVDYHGRYGRAQGGYNYSDTNQQVNYGVQGGVVVHPYGVTAGQALGSNMALVRAPGASNIKVQNQTGVRTDSRGYALVPYLSSYRNNRVALDPMSLGDDIDIDAPVTTVVPTAGAIVLADFKARVGGRALIALTYQGKPVPFGATAALLDAGKETSSGIVADAGTVYLSGLPDSGQLTVKWGRAASRQCTADYRFEPPARHSKALAVVNLAAVCR